MSKQTKSISANEKQLAELERMYHTLESQIGFIILNSRDARQSIPKESAPDAEMFFKLQTEKDNLSRAVHKLREHARHQKECAAELSKLKRSVKNSAECRFRISEAFGRALAELYTDSSADFFKNAYEEISALETKIKQAEEELRENSAPQSGFFASIKTTIGRSAKKASVIYSRQKLSKAYASAGTDAFQNAELKMLFDANELPVRVQSAYKNMRASEEEFRAFKECQEDLTRQIEEDACLINAIGTSSGTAGNAAAKIRELEKEINKAAIDERLCAARAGKRFIESQRGHTGDDGLVAADCAFEKEAAPLLERAKALQNEIEALKDAIEKAKREIESANTAKAIESLRNQVMNIEKQMHKLSAEKTDAQNEIEMLSEKLKSLRSEE